MCSAASLLSVQAAVLSLSLKSFESPFQLGGSVTLADFCPYVQEFTWRSDSDDSSRGSQCFDETNNPEPNLNFGLEEYGDGAICVEQGSTWQQRSCTMMKQVYALRPLQGF